MVQFLISRLNVAQFISGSKTKQDEIRSQFTISRQVLLNACGNGLAVSAAYPTGDFDQRVVIADSACGYPNCVCDTVAIVGIANR